MSTKEGLALIANVYCKENGWKYGGGHYYRQFPDKDDDTHYELEETRHTRYFFNLCNDTFHIDGRAFLDNKEQKEKCICEHDM